MKRSSRRGVTLVEILIVIAIMGILLAIVLPGLEHTRIQAEESAAKAHVRAILQAQAMYSAANGRFAHSLEDLGKPKEFLPPELTNGKVGKYRYTVAATPTGFEVSATADAASGRRSYQSDETNMIREAAEVEDETDPVPMARRGTSK